MKFVLKSPIDKESAVVQVRALCWIDGNSFPETILTTDLWCSLPSLVKHNLKYLRVCQNMFHTMVIFLVEVDLSSWKATSKFNCILKQWYCIEFALYSTAFMYLVFIGNLWNIYKLYFCWHVNWLIASTVPRLSQAGMTWIGNETVNYDFPSKGELDMRWTFNRHSQ